VALSTAQKSEILAEYGLSKGDTGSPEAQVALLTSGSQTLRNTSSTTSTTITPGEGCC
jgi:ribosomal protein S15P/S13E